MTSGRTSVDVSLELVQAVVLDREVLARFKPGPVVVRTTARGRSQWLRTPPSTVRERPRYHRFRSIMRSFKPEGYPAVSPYLVTPGATRVVEFLKQAFGAREVRRFDTPDGTIMHAEVRIEDSVIMIGEAGGEWPPAPSHLHVYVDDVDAVYQHALTSGGVSVQEPVQREGDSDRRGGVKDPGGNIWWIGTQLE